jgi:hypothetical protein
LVYGVGLGLSKKWGGVCFLLIIMRRGSGGCMAEGKSLGFAGETKDFYGVFSRIFKKFVGNA